jgi:cytochrome c-type biogenesis protein CcmE
LLSPGAVIRQDYATIAPQNLKAGQQIVVIGEPNDQGQIQAKFIRIINQN